MFDSLKEKLGRFQDDVEETAEENAEPVEDAGDDPDAGAAPGETTDEPPVDDPTAGDDPDPGDSTGDPDGSSTADAAPADADDAPATSEETARDADGDTDEDDSGGLFGRSSGSGDDEEEEDDSGGLFSRGSSDGDDDEDEEDSGGLFSRSSGSDSDSDDEEDDDSGGLFSRGSSDDDEDSGGLFGRSSGSDSDGDSTPDDAGEDDSQEVGPADSRPDPDPGSGGVTAGEGGTATAEASAATADPDGEADPDVDEDDSEEEKGTGTFRKIKSAAKGKFVIEEEDLEDPLWELEMALLESDVEMSVAEEILDGIREELVGETRTFTESTSSVVEDALRSALLEVIGVGQFDFDRRVQEADKPVVVVFTGINGVGKTTTIAKLARRFEQRGLTSVLANGDTYRAGANEQITEHAENLDTKLITHQQGGDPAAVIYDAVEYAEANDVDVVLGDTAGRLHTDDDLMDQLEKIHRVVDPDMTLFVDEAVAGQDATRRAREFDDAAEIDGAVLTKADADANGGAAISIAQVTGKPILFLGTGQGYDDLVRFDPEWMVDQLLGADED